MRSNGLLDTLNDINMSLTTLAWQVRNEALAGLGSRNKVAEYILLPVLRRVYDAPELANTNATAANFPGIDLFDPSSGLGVQITSDTTAAKISGTIETLVAGTVPLKRLVIALVSETTPRFQTKTRAKWQAATHEHFDFEPTTDILAFDRLLNRIQNLSPTDITAIATDLQALVRGVHAIDLLPHLRQQVEAQLAEEQRVARYIPDVFVETRDTKYQARCFAHPALFVHRIADWFDRQPFAGLNRLVSMSGVPSVSTLDTQDIVAARTPAEAAVAARVAMEDLDRLHVTLASYREIVQTGGAAVARQPDRAYVLDETRYSIEMIAGGLERHVGARRAELQCVAARFFLLTGPAGRGKTNFLCDFTERFLLRHETPCAYITARQLGRNPDPDLAEAVCRLIFPSTVSSLQEGLIALKATCDLRGQPFVLVIDGLNEHPDVRTFAGQLEQMLQTLLQYPHVRVLMTCRSEFFEERFGALRSGPLAPFMHVLEAHGQLLDDEQYRELVGRYFSFFKVRRRLVAPGVIKFLQQDVLLLRFFCEAYGARDRGEAYEQPYVAHIYRHEIFQRYVEDKLGRAYISVTSDRTSARPLVRRARFQTVLSLIAAHMLKTGRFVDVPRNVVPPDLDIELTALLDEELVLRRDLIRSPALLVEPEEVLNFTFDEMRDFLLAQYLLGLHSQDSGEFDRLVSMQQPTATQSTEGVQRFLFHASRVPENDAFYRFYREHPWYNAVYDTEVFAVPPAHLNSEDRQAVETALAAGGSRAQHFARQLAYRWESSVFPALNLELLLTIARNANPSFFADVIVPTFGRANGEGSLGETFCRSVEKDVLPNLQPDKERAFDPIFRLLLHLLPVDATTTLRSPAMGTLQRLVSAHPAYAIGLLQEFLKEGKRLHRPFLWRLLQAASSAIDDPTRFIAAAQVDLADPTSDVVVRREAQRFVRQVSEGENGL